jgi:hypothetical protein
MFNPALTVLLPLAPPPGRHGQVDEVEVWLGFVNMTEGVGVSDASDEDVLTLVKALEYA